MKTCLFIIATFTAFSFNQKAFAQIINTIAGSGSVGYSGDGGSGTSAMLNHPVSVAVDGGGNMYIADYSNNRIRVLTATGTINTIAGNGSAGFSGDGGQATAAQLNTPTGVALDRSGNLYIADRSNNRVRKVSSTGIISTVAGTGTAGFSGDGGQATAAYLNVPINLAIDAGGNIYISDNSNARIRKVNSSGIISTIAGTGTPGYSGDGGMATAAQLNSPMGIVTDGTGNVYFADRQNNRIRKISPSGVITTIAGNGTSGFSGDGGAATAARLATPADVSIDGRGNLYIADQYNHRIRIVGPTNIINTIAGTTSAGFSGDGGPATAAQLNYPRGLTSDTAGNVFVCDELNERVRRISSCLPHVAALSGPDSVCEGSTVTLIDDTAGGTWRSINSAIASVNTTGVVLGLTAGITQIVYTLTSGCGADSALHTITVLPAPEAGVVTGPDSVCPGLTITLTDTVSGGSWSSSDTTLATISSSGVVLGVSSGLDTIRYIVTNICGADTAFFPVYIRNLASCPNGTNPVYHPDREKLIVFPNPSNGYINTYISSASGKDVQLTITNSLGEISKSIQVPTNKELSIPLDLPANLYFLSVYTDQRLINTKILTIR